MIQIKIQNDAYLDGLSVILMGSMGEVHTGDVHAVDDHLLEHLDAAACWTNGADDPGLADRVWWLANVQLAQMLQVAGGTVVVGLLFLSKKKN